MRTEQQTSPGRRVGMLWFAFKIVPLIYLKQPRFFVVHPLRRCDLLSKLYLWSIWNSVRAVAPYPLAVVICFQNCTFDLSETACQSNAKKVIMLWFAFKIVPLIYLKQRIIRIKITAEVVICFQNCTFDLSETAILLGFSDGQCCDLLSKLYLWSIWNSGNQQVEPVTPLWFAFKIVPLIYLKQPRFPYNDVQNCCDLLSKLYLWSIWNSSNAKPQQQSVVVICFQNCTFDLSETAAPETLKSILMLWFAFKIVPLIYLKQHRRTANPDRPVVICFQNCTFDLSETAVEVKDPEDAPLWFAFKIVPLIYLKQPRSRSI